ncbi:MAG: class I SAM-dependent methyltransferase [Ignavibacterium sp.]|nr:class I SAM-dependent methyltransferase [Ignavibacterium sp.]MDW8376406.1 class I SAM-dependent methyltransferase [Ignavibacteriales bacterium]
MNKEFWDERFSTDEYIYGTEPNEVLREQIISLKPGKIFLPAEGEGRNAVFAAFLGWKVDVADFSEKAREKALKLAREKNAQINYILSDILEYKYPEKYYDLDGIFFLRLSYKDRIYFFNKIISSLKIGGLVIIEVFNENQMKNNFRGLKNLEVLYDEEEIKEYFNSLKKLFILSLVIDLNEGNYHKGKANVIRFIGIKK